jgi:hypothetical protein
MKKKSAIITAAILVLVIGLGLGLGLGFRNEIAAFFRGNNGDTQTTKSGGNVSTANPTDVQIVEMLYTEDATKLTNTAVKKLIPTDVTPESNEVTEFIYGFQIAWLGLTNGDKINAPVTNLKIGGSATNANQFTVRYAFGLTKPTNVTSAGTQYTVTTADGDLYLYVSIKFTNLNENIPSNVASAISGGEISFDIVTSITKTA